MPDYRLFWGPDMGSVAPQAVLEELGLAYDMVQVNFGAGEHKNPDYQAVNPLGKVPALQLPDGSILTESAAIVLYLCDLVPAAGLLPAPDHPDRARALRWLLFLASDVYGCSVRIYAPDDFCSDAAHADSVVRAASAAFDRYSRLIEAEALQPGPFVLGERFSAVDIYLAMVMRWHPDREALLAEAPRLSALDDLVLARPAVRKAFEDHQIL